MSINNNDWRLSAWALNEHDALSETDKQEIQDAIKENPELSTVIEELRSAAGLMKETYSADKPQNLSDDQRIVVLNKTAPKRSVIKLIAPLAAACLAIGGSMALILPTISKASHSDDAPIRISMNEAQQSVPPHSTEERENGRHVTRTTRNITDLDVTIEDSLVTEDPVVVDLDIEVTEIETEDLVPTKGREEQVATTESGGAAVFMSIGASGGSGLKGSRTRMESIERPVPIESDNYNSIKDNNFRELSIKGNDFSTFSIDVDTASYSDMRSHIQRYGRLPKASSVRIEEMINYFDYQYTAPKNDNQHPFRYHVESSICPWKTEHRLLRIGIQGKRIAKTDRPPTRLVFLIDTSGSMSDANKLGLLKRSFKMLVEQLDERDQVAIVTYAGSAGLALAPTFGNDKQTILSSLDRLSAGGSTNGAGGIQQAYQVAQQIFDKEAENRVILATDGDFNVGISDQTALVNLLKDKAESGIFLNIHGYGMGNRKDGRMEAMSNNGNGTYAYIDNIREAQKVMVDDLTGSLVTIAKDVKIQCVFNPKHVAAWRLIGYENRILAKEDFNNDKKDAGEIGAGHNVTAIYEIVPSGVDLPNGSVDPSPFVKQKPETDKPKKELNDSPAWLELRLRYKQPQGDTSTLLKEQVIVHDKTFESADENFRWAASVAGFGMQLRNSPHKGNLTWEQVLNMAKNAKGKDDKGHRAECIRLIEMAKGMQ